MSDRMIKRHTGAGIFMHWFNAAAWFFLTFTGLALIDNPSLQYLGQAYPRAVRSFFGGAGSLLVWHWVVGGIWAVVWLGFIVLKFKEHVLPFLKQITSYVLPRDLEWMIKKNFQMTLGYKAMGKLVKFLKMDNRIPDQEFYNAGQKAAAVGLVLSGLGLLASGVVMVMSKYLLGPSWVWLVQWCIVIHFISAGIALGLLFLHIYMAAISKDERPAFISMFSGKVPAHYAEHHHKIWYDQISG